MPAPLPQELRDRFARLIEEGLTGREAARRLQVSAATGGRWAQQIRNTGTATVAPMGRPAGTGKLSAHIGFFRELVSQDPDITLFELRDALADAEDVTVHHSAIAGLLKRLGFTHKSKGDQFPDEPLVATERRRAKVKRQRDDWRAHRSPAIAQMPDRVVFLPSHRCRQRLPGSGRNSGEDQPHPATWPGTSG